MIKVMKDNLTVSTPMHVHASSLSESSFDGAKEEAQDEDS